LVRRIRTATNKARLYEMIAAEGAGLAGLAFILERLPVGKALACPAILS
jgi:hypothetical protein